MLPLTLYKIEKKRKGELYLKLFKTSMIISRLVCIIEPLIRPEIQEYKFALMSILTQRFCSKQIYNLVVGNQEAAREFLYPFLLPIHLTQVEQVAACCLAIALLL